MSRTPNTSGNNQVKEGTTKVEEWFTRTSTTSIYGDFNNALLMGINEHTNTNNIKKLGVIKLKSPVVDDDKVTRKCLIFNYGYIKTRLLDKKTHEYATTFLNQLRRCAENRSDLDSARGRHCSTGLGGEAGIVAMESLDANIKKAIMGAKLSISWMAVSELGLWRKRVVWNKRRQKKRKKRADRTMGNMDRTAVAAGFTGLNISDYWRDKSSGNWYGWSTGDGQPTKLFVIPSDGRPSSGTPHAVVGRRTAVCADGSTSRLAFTMTGLNAETARFFKTGLQIRVKGEVVGKVVAMAADYTALGITFSNGTLPGETEGVYVMADLPNARSWGGFLVHTPDHRGELIFAGSLGACWTLLNDTGKLDVINYSSTVTGWHAMVWDSLVEFLTPDWFDKWFATLMAAGDRVDVNHDKVVRAWDGWKTTKEARDVPERRAVPLSAVRSFGVSDDVDRSGDVLRSDGSSVDTAHDGGLTGDTPAELTAAPGVSASSPYSRRMEMGGLQDEIPKEEGDPGAIFEDPYYYDVLNEYRVPRATGNPTIDAQLPRAHATVGAARTVSTLRVLRENCSRDAVAVLVDSHTSARKVLDAWYDTLDRLFNGLGYWCMALKGTGCPASAVVGVYRELAAAREILVEARNGRPLFGFFGSRSTWIEKVGRALEHTAEVLEESEEELKTAFGLVQYDMGMPGGSGC